MSRPDTKQAMHIDMLANLDPDLRITRWLGDEDDASQDETMWGADPAVILEHKESLDDDYPIN